MKKDEITLDGRDLLRSIDVSVKFGVKWPRFFGARVWIATRLFQLGGFFSGTNVVIEIDDERGGDPSSPTWAEAGYPR